MAKKETMSDESVIEVFKLKARTRETRLRLIALVSLVALLCVLAVSFLSVTIGRDVTMSGNFDCTTGELGLETEFINPYFNATIDKMVDYVIVNGKVVNYYENTTIPVTKTEWQGKYIKINGINGMRCSGSGSIKAPVWLVLVRELQ